MDLAAWLTRGLVPVRIRCHQRANPAGVELRRTTSAGAEVGHFSGGCRFHAWQQFLPTVVDKLTPNGSVPEHSNLLQMGESILASLGKTGS